MVSFEQAFALDNNDNNHHHNIRDVSFSCYLNNSEESLIRELAQENRKYHVSKNEEEGEIGVFGAEKYFKGGMDNDDVEEKSNPEKNCARRKSSYANHEQVTRSESSYHSQSALLKKVHSRKKSSKATQMKNFLAGLGCSCSDKDSINIDENVAKESINQVKENPKLSKENIFSLPTPSPKLAELPRETLDVFGSPVFDINRKSLTLERKLNTLSWNSNAPSMEKSIASGGSGSYNDDDDSDASSDLFEIDNFFGKINNFPQNYAPPREASIEWSVVTDSVTDFGEPCPKIKQVPMSHGNSKTSSEIGCDNQKATRVVEGAYKNSDKLRMRRVSNSFTPAMRIQAEANVSGFNQREQQPTLGAAHSLPRPYSPQYSSSHLLYI